MKYDRIYAYAYLRAAVNSGMSNPVSVLRPLFKRAFSASRKGHAGAIPISAARSWIAESFGFDVPTFVAEFVCRELTSSGQLIYDKVKYGYFLQPTQASEDEQNEKQARDHYNSVIQSIKRTLIDQEKSWEPTEVVEDWLDKSPLSFMGMSGGPKKAARRDYELQYVIRATIERDGDSFLSDLADVAVGDAIYRGIAELCQYSSWSDIEDRKKIRTTFVLDGPLVMAAIGFASQYRKDAVRELLSMGNQLGVKFGVFEHSIFEIEKIVLGAANSIAYGGNASNDIRAFIFEEALTPSALLEKRMQVRPSVTDQFSIVKVPNITAETSVSEGDLYALIEEKLKQRFPDATEQDVRSLTAIYRLWDASAREYFENSGYTFVTANKSLADTSTRFFQESFRSEGKVNRSQLCLHAPVFASRLWTKLPKIGSGIARSQILWHISSALRPHPELKESFRIELEKLFKSGAISEENKRLVEFSHFTDELLSESHFFDRRSLQAGEARSILAKALSKFKSWKEQKEKEIGTRLETEYGGRIESLEKEFDGAVVELSRIEGDKRDFAEKAKELEEQLDGTLSRIGSAIDRVERAADVSYWVVVWFLVLLGIFLTVSALLDETPGITFKEIAAILTALLGIYLAGAGERLHALRSGLRSYFLKHLGLPKE